MVFVYGIMSFQQLKNDSCGPSESECSSDREHKKNKKKHKNKDKDREDKPKEDKKNKEKSSGKQKVRICQLSLKFITAAHNCTVPQPGHLQLPCYKIIDLELICCRVNHNTEPSTEARIAYNTVNFIPPLVKVVKRLAINRSRFQISYTIFL